MSFVPVGEFEISESSMWYGFKLCVMYDVESESFLIKGNRTGQTKWECKELDKLDNFGDKEIILYRIQSNLIGFLIHFYCPNLNLSIINLINEFLTLEGCGSYHYHYLGWIGQKGVTYTLKPYSDTLNSYGEICDFQRQLLRLNQEDLDKKISFDLPFFNNCFDESKKIIHYLTVNRKKRVKEGNFQICFRCKQPDTIKDLTWRGLIMCPCKPKRIIDKSKMSWKEINET